MGHIHWSFPRIQNIGLQTQDFEALFVKAHVHWSGLKLQYTGLQTQDFGALFIKASPIFLYQFEKLHS